MKYKETIEWIEMESRDMTEEEIEEAMDLTGFSIDDFNHVVYTNEMPNEGEMVLVKTECGVFVDVYSNCFQNSFDDYEFYEVIAWASLPKGIKPKEIE